MEPNTLIYESECANPEGLTLNLRLSLSPVRSTRREYLAHIASDQPARRPKFWSRKVRSGRALFRWTLQTCAERARVALTGDAIDEMTEALSRTDTELGEEFLAAQVEYLIEGSLWRYELEPPDPPTLGRLIAKRAKWLDRDGGGGGYIGWAFRESLRQKAMRQFVEGHLAVTGTPPLGENPLFLTYGPPGSRRDIIQNMFPSATGTVQGRFHVSTESVQEAQKEYDAFFRGPFGVLGGLSSCEAGWYDGPSASQHKTFESAVKRYRRLRPKLVRNFIAEAQKIVRGIRKGWFMPTDTHNLRLAVIRPSACGEDTEVIANITMTWEPRHSGAGVVTDCGFDPNWADYFPAA